MTPRERVLVWFSCGAASAVAAKKAVQLYSGRPVEVLYCDTLKYEHPDNARFLRDVQRWIGQEIKILHNNKYSDIMDVYRKTKFLVGIHGAPCTRLLKRDVRISYSSPIDIHVFGMTADEQRRIDRFEKQNQQLYVEWPLRDGGISKSDCYKILTQAGIALPLMYRLGYRNNNCIGCVKGGAGYWNKIRRDFPERFKEMAKLERQLGATICKYRGNRIHLDELPENAGRYNDEDVECGVLCTSGG